MKRLLLILCFMLVSTPAFCGSDIYAIIDAKAYNEFLNRSLPTQFFISMDEENPGVAGIMINETIYKALILIDEPRRNRIISIINKYIEWNKQASANNVNLEKEIDTVNVTDICFSLGNENYVAYSADIKFSFSSENTKTHRLGIDFEEFHGRQNEFVTFKPQDLYLNYSSAVKLRDALTDESLNKSIANMKKEKAISEQFK